MVQYSSWVLLLLWVAAGDAFSLSPSTTTTSISRRRTPIFRHATADVSAETDREELFKMMGMPEEKLALGIRPYEVVRYIGSRDDLITKTMDDIPSLDRPKAEIEVDKFLLDAEMLNIYIQYGKEIERDPNFKVPDAKNSEDGLFSFRNLVIAYILFIAYTTLPNAVREYVADQEVAGTWTATGIGFLDNWIDDTSPAATAKALERAAKAAADATAAAAGMTE